MTIIEIESAATAQEETDAAASPSAPARRRLPVAALVWLALAALAALALVGWWIWSAVAASAVDGVRVGYDAQPLRCEGSEVGVVPSTENPEFLQPIADLTPGMRCELRIQVVNAGWSEITVTTVGLIGLYDDNPLGLEAAFVNPNGQERLADQDDEARRDVLAGAFFEISGGITVPVGESATFTAVFDYAGGAHMSECSSQGWNMPVVSVTALGAVRDVQPAGEDAVWIRAGSRQECEEQIE